MIFRTKHILLDYFICTYSIILESSYSLYDRAFADNIGTVLFYAVIVSLCSFIFVSPLDSSRASRKDLKWIETTTTKKKHSQSRFLASFLPSSHTALVLLLSPRLSMSPIQCCILLCVSAVMGCCVRLAITGSVAAKMSKEHWYMVRLCDAEFKAPVEACQPITQFMAPETLADR